MLSKHYKRLGIFAILALAPLGSNLTYADDYAWEKVVQAPVDESYFGPGDPRNLYDPHSNKHPLPGSIEKRNGGYAWGVTNVGDEIWYGAFINGWCDIWLYHAGLPARNEQSKHLYNYSSKINACSIPDNNRKPELYIFNTKTDDLEIYSNSDQEFNQYWDGVKAIRGAGNINGIIFVAGLVAENIKPSEHMSNEADEYFWDGTRIFAIDVKTRKYLGSVLLDGLNEIRELKTVEHPDGTQGLYLAASNRGGESYLMRWTGTKENPFPATENKKFAGFDIVIDNSGYGLIGEIVPFSTKDGSYRLAFSTWHSWPAHKKSGGLIVTSPMPESGFSKSKPATTKPVFMLEDFDPDKLFGYIWGGGLLSEYRGKFYFGTMMIGNSYARDYYQYEKTLAESKESQEQLVKATYSRAAHLFEIDLADLDAPQVRMLYGNEYLPAYNEKSKKWEMRRNKMALKPVHGNAGFGFGTNNYTWKSFVYKDRLFIGTMDYSGGLEDYIHNTPYDEEGQEFFIHTAYRVAQERGYVGGGDLIVLEDPEMPVKVLSSDGFGNENNNGFRTFVEVNGDLYIGTSSEANIGKNAGYAIYRFNINDGQ